MGERKGLPPCFICDGDGDGEITENERNILWDAWESLMEQAKERAASLPNPPEAPND